MEKQILNAHCKPQCFFRFRK